MGGPFTYLIMELGWSLPVILLQWTVGRQILWAHRRALVLGVAIPTVYLSLADALAIEQGIWSLSPSLTLGLELFGVPLEEAVFFFLTNVMVVQGLILLRFGDPREITDRVWRLAWRRAPLRGGSADRPARG